MIPDLQQLSTTTRDLRKFGLVVGGVFLLLGGWFLFRHKAARALLLDTRCGARALRFRRAACARGCLRCLDESGLYWVCLSPRWSSRSFTSIISLDSGE